jgi:ABC-type sugar transport system permease subunit
MNSSGDTTRRRVWALQHRAAPYLFALPIVVLLCIFLLYPLGRSAVLSFHKSAGPGRTRFVGLENYAFLLRDKLFWIAVANTLGFTALFVTLQVPASLGLAMLLNSPRVRFRNLLRLAFFSSYLVGTVFAAVLFGMLLAPRHGLVNRVVGALLPFVGTETNWRGDPRWAMPALVLAALWLTVGYGMVYFLAALQSVDRELYDAAEVDGAGAWARFRHVTLPGVKPVLVFLVLVGTIASLQLFELPYVLFQGPGPGLRGMTVVYYLYAYGISAGNFGFASAVGWALVLLTSLIAAAWLKASGAAKEI